MADNVGLSTPRGSGTSGYVQKNRAFLRPRDDYRPNASSSLSSTMAASAAPRQPDKGILEHDRKRAIEVKVFALRDDLEDKGVPEDEIDQQCDQLRERLTREAQQGGGGRSADSSSTRTRFKPHQVHEQARAKLAESERLRRALHIRPDYQEGAHWRRQEEKAAQAQRRAAEAAAAAEKARQPVPVRSVEEEGEIYSDAGSVSSRNRSRSRSRTPPRKAAPRDGRSPSRSPSRSRSRSPRRYRDRRSPVRRGPVGRSPSHSVSRSVSRSMSRSPRHSRSVSRSISRSPSRSPSRSRSPRR